LAHPVSAVYWHFLYGCYSLHICFFPFIDMLGHTRLLKDDITNGWSVLRWDLEMTAVECFPEHVFQKVYILWYKQHKHKKYCIIGCSCLTLGIKLFNYNGLQEMFAFLVRNKPEICFKLHTAVIPTRTYILHSQHRSLITNEDSLLLDKSFFIYTFFFCCKIYLYIYIFFTE